MANRALVVLLGVLLLGVPLVPVTAQVVVIELFPNVSLGFDQSSLTPLYQGTPLYTQGDQLWIVSNYNFPIIATLAPPTGGNPEAFGTLYPGQPAALHTFSTGDPVGTWILDLSNRTGFVASLGITVVGLNETSSVLLSGASVSSGFLTTSYSLHADGAYDLQACVLGSRTNPLQLTIPQGYGTGVTLLNMTGSGYTLAVRGAVFNPTEFWFELYHPYSFATPGGNASTVFSTLVQVATSSRLVLGQTAGANVSTGTMSFEAGPREGRYTLRGYFRSTQGIQVVEAQLLLQSDGTWLPLADCVASSQPSGLAFSLKTPLQAPVGVWPREAVVMFRVGGLEDYTAAPVDPGLTAITLMGTPWNQTLSDLAGSASGVGVEGSETINGTVYVLSSVYPATDNIAISLGGTLYQTMQTQLVASYSMQTMMVPAGKLVVQTTLNGAPSAGTRVSLSGRGNATITKVGNSGGKATFYLPAGNFTVSAGTGGSVSSGVQVTAGKETDVTLELGGEQFGTAIWILAVFGVVGLGANVFVWWRWWRNRRPG